jgi:fatty acid desaturase
MLIDHFRTTQKALIAERQLGPSDVVGAVTFAAELCVTAAAIVALANLPRWSVGFWAMEALCGVLIFHWFAVLHECGHKTMFSQTRWNTVAGHVASVFCLIPYTPWRAVHLAHHRWVGVIDKDPTQQDLLDFLRRQPLKHCVFWIMWKMWIPVPIVFFLYKTFWGYPIHVYRTLSASDWRHAVVSTLVCLTIPVVLAFGIGPGAALAYFGPMLVVFYFLIENTNLPQHSELFPHLSDAHPQPIRVSEQDEVTRSTHLPDWLSTALLLNFNRHTEHHLFPAAPWFRLNRLRRRLLADGYTHPHEVIFLPFMLGLRRRDPMSVYRDSLPRPMAGAE